LLGCDLTRTIDDVCPAVAEVPEAGDLASVVATHVAPSFASPIVAEASVELDVESELLDDDIQVLNLAAGATHLPTTLRQAVAASESCISDLER
jgi:hypothetical protein